MRQTGDQTSEETPDDPYGGPQKQHSRSRRAFLVGAGGLSTMGFAGCLSTVETLTGRIEIGGASSPFFADIVEEFRRVNPDVSLSLRDDDPDVRFTDTPVSTAHWINLEGAPDAVAALRDDGEWCSCLDGVRRDTLLEDDTVETWSEIEGDLDSLEALEGVAPKRGTTVLARGVRRNQYAIGHGGVGYYEANPANIEPTTDLDGATPLARLRFGSVDRSALDRPEVEAFVESYTDAVTTLTNEVRYFTPSG
jgi:hypothetical protein